MKRIAKTKTLIIENVPLDMGLRPKDIVIFLTEELKKTGELGDLHIVDVELNPFNNKTNNNCISV